MRTLAILVLATAPAHADRGVHGSVGVGGSLLLTGDGGDRGRLDVAVDVKLRSRFGGIVAWRAFDENHGGLVTAGVVYEGGAARPRLVLDLYANVGFDIDATAPLVGGGVRTTLAIIGPLGVVLDSGAQLVIDGLSATRLQIASGAFVAGRF